MTAPSGGRDGRTRLLFVSISLVGGGAEKILVRLLNALDPGRYDLRLVLFESKLDYLHELAPHIKVACFEKTRRTEFFRILAHLRHILSGWRPDAVVSLLDYANVVTFLSALGLRRRPRIILCEHNFTPRWFQGLRFGTLIQMLKRFCYRRADEVVVVSKGIERMFLQRYKLAPERVRVIYNPIPLAEVRERARESVSHPFLDDPSLRVVVAAGRLERIKRYDRLLDGFARARREHAGLRLIVLGKGSLLGALRAQAERLGVAGDVGFAGFHPNPYAWIARADVFALTSESEGFPNVLIESLALGVPVVSVDCQTGPDEIVVPGENGLLVPEEDPAALARALIAVCGDPAARARMGEAGKTFAERFTLARIVPEYEALWTSPGEGRQP